MKIKSVYFLVLMGSLVGGHCIVAGDKPKQLKRQSSEPVKRTQGILVNKRIAEVSPLEASKKTICDLEKEQQILIQKEQTLIQDKTILQKELEVKSKECILLQALKSDQLEQQKSIFERQNKELIEKLNTERKKLEGDIVDIQEQLKEELNRNILLLKKSEDRKVMLQAKDKRINQLTKKNTLANTLLVSKVAELKSKEQKIQNQENTYEVEIFRYKLKLGILAIIIVLLLAQKHHLLDMLQFS